ncbi:hypothetical protein [Methylobacterium sp. JK268]
MVLGGYNRAHALTPDYGTTFALFGGVKVAEAQRDSRGGLGVVELAARESAIDNAMPGGVERDASEGTASTPTSGSAAQLVW